ncbi:MAG: hypothetical protein BGO49_07475 [Planctomycetales bacterium 71-10]|mgnify:CR=1 FL=1|nr:MAG: hypothetical protein BGO49_07475 [Planctomycetales bacterium 71-10]
MSKRPAARRPAPRVRRRFAFEALEGRRLPASIVVTSADDSGPGTLRQALVDAATGAYPGPDDITFADDLGPIVLTSGQLTIDSPVTITGAPSRTLVARAGDAGAFSVFEVASGVEATLEDLEVTGGSVPDYFGGGVRNWGTLTIRSSAIYGNEARYGGGVSSYAADPGSSASLTLEGVEVASNAAGDYGGGVYNAAGGGAIASLTISSSSFHDNRAFDGGGVYNTAYGASATLAVSGSTFDRDAADGSGGAICNIVFVDGSTVEAVLDGVTITGTAAETGGGVANLAYAAGSTARLRVRDDRIDGATASWGGGGVANVASGAGATASVGRDDSAADRLAWPLWITATADLGGGVYNSASQGAEATFVARSWLMSCVATSAGGGVYNLADGDGSSARVAPPYEPAKGGSLLVTSNSAGFGGGVFSQSSGGGSAAVDLFAAYVSTTSATDSGGAVYSQASGAGSTSSVSFVGSLASVFAGSFGAGIMSTAYDGAAATTYARADIRSATAGRGGAFMSYAYGAGSIVGLTVEDSTLISYTSAVDASAGGGAAASTVIRRTSIGLAGLGRRPAGVLNFADGAGSTAVLDVVGSTFVGLAGESGAAIRQGASAGGAASLQVSGTSFTDNQAAGDGGAIAASADGAGSASHLVVVASTFAGNVAEGDGGAIALAARDGGLGAGQVSTSTFDGGLAARDGGAIHASESGAAPGSRVEVSGSTFGRVAAGRDGGAIAVAASGRTQVGWVVAVRDSSFADTSAGRDGGALALTSADSKGAYFQLLRSTVARASAMRNGGGISIVTSAGDALLDVQQSDLSEAVAGSRGGGLASNAGAGGAAQVTARATTIRDSSALLGGGASNFAAGGVSLMQFFDGTIHGNSAQAGGGGIHNGSSQAGSRATLNLFGSTVDGNVTEGNGGGFFNIAAGSTAQSVVVSSTIAQNRAGQYGGGLGNFVSGGGTARLDVSAATIAANAALVQGGGAYNGFADSYSSGVSASLRSTIVAGSTGGDLRGAGSFAGSSNLVQDGSGPGLAGTISGDPRLGPLADDGGPTLTMALMPGSPAINAGETFGPSDQRGTGFPRVLQGRADIGAYESPYVPAVQLASLGSATADGTYGRGSTVLVTARFTGPVTVSGSPRLRLDTGAWASYVSGSGSDALTFRYVVAPGESASRLDAASTSALDLNGGSIANTDGYPAGLAVPVGAAPGSLASNANVAIDAVAPVVLEYYVRYGTRGWYRLDGSTRRTLPWMITGVSVLFSKPIAQASLASLSGLSATTMGWGGSWVTWSFNGVTQANVLTRLSGTGAAAIKDEYGNPLGDGAGHAQALRVLYGDFDDDGVVTSADMVFPRYNAGTFFSPRYVYYYNMFADLNGDGVVDNADVLVARSRIGARLP